MQRDFTYIDDIIEALWDSPKAPEVQRPDTSNTEAPFKLYNIGNNNPIELGRFIRAIETATELEAQKNNLRCRQGTFR